MQVSRLMSKPTILLLAVSGLTTGALFATRVSAATEYATITGVEVRGETASMIVSGDVSFSGCPDKHRGNNVTPGLVYLGGPDVPVSAAMLALVMRARDRGQPVRIELAWTNTSPAYCITNIVRDPY